MLQFCFELDLSLSSAASISVSSFALRPRFILAIDVMLISPNEKFYWDGNMTLHISCTPAFTPEQHIHIS